MQSSVVRWHMLNYDRHHLFEAISLVQVLVDLSVVFSKGFPDVHSDRRYLGDSQVLDGRNFVA